MAANIFCFKTRAVEVLSWAKTSNVHHVASVWRKQGYSMIEYEACSTSTAHHELLGKSSRQTRHRADPVEFWEVEDWEARGRRKT